MIKTVETPGFGRVDVEELGQEPLHRGAYRMDRYTLRHRTFAGGWSQPIQREVFTPGDSVAVLPFDPARETVVLITQFRIGAYAHGGEPWLIETVAGRIKPGETPEGVARREAMEEAGCHIDRLIPAGGILPSPGGMNEYIHLYVGTLDSRDVGGTHGLPDEHEDIAVQVVPFPAALEALEAGRIVSGPVVMLLQWLALHRARLG